jgi:hypothetical protein
MATNYRATAEAFTQLLIGEITYKNDGTFSFVGSPGTIPLFNISTIITPSQPTWTFELAQPNLSSTIIEGMFASVIASFMIMRRDMEDVNVLFFGGSAWEYDTRLLWAIYGPTLFVFGFFVAYGLWCIKQDGAVESTFLKFLVSTRGEDFDRAASNRMILIQ